MKQTLTIPPEAVGERADKFLASSLPASSRSFWQKQFSLGHITHNGKQVRPSSSLEPGELTIDVPSQPLVASELPILYEDDDVLVINKPTGVLTHAKGTITEEQSVADFVRPRTTDGADTNRPGIVHRLDRDTSGVIIAAKHPQAKSWLQKQFADRKVKKTYLALVEGRVEPAKALLKLPLERNPKAPQKFRVGAGGKSAETEYEVKEYLPRHTLVVLRPRTGRTHQLRVHMAYLGHPIVGDRFYGSHKGRRLFLHAQSLELTLPNKQRRTFDAPLPPDLLELLQEYR